MISMMSAVGMKPHASLQMCLRLLSLYVLDDSNCTRLELAKHTQEWSMPSMSLLITVSNVKGFQVLV